MLYTTVVFMNMDMEHGCMEHGYILGQFGEKLTLVKPNKMRSFKLLICWVNIVISYT